MRCRNCGEQISQHNYYNGPGGSHDDSTFGGYTYCRRTTAQPEADTSDRAVVLVPAQEDNK